MTSTTMELLIYLFLPLALFVAGAASLVLRRRVKATAIKLRCAKVSTAALGSACIIWSVYALAPLLQLLVIFVATAWLSKRVVTEGPTLGLHGTFRAIRLGRRLSS